VELVEGVRAAEFVALELAHMSQLDGKRLGHHRDQSVIASITAIASITVIRIARTRGKSPGGTGGEKYMPFPFPKRRGE
jgi:hypothetical protein